MTYIRIESNYYDIDSISKMISVPQTIIEEIVDKGLSGIEECFLTKETISTINKMRFATSISSFDLESDITSELIKSYEDQELFTKSLENFLESKRIDKSEYQQIKDWV